MDRATKMIKNFEKMWGSEYLDLASHAAFPLAVTPELLYLMMENFLPDCPWIAVADLLLSGLCLTVGDELYEMESAVRHILLSRLAGKPRLHELAQFMTVYVEAKLPEVPNIDKYLGTDLQWIALAYIKPGDASRLREKLMQLLQQKKYKDHKRVASFLENQGDLLIAAGFEPVVTSISSYLNTGSPPHLFDVEVVTLELEEAPKLEFSTVFVNKRGEIVKTQLCEAYYYDETLGQSIRPIRMIAIPGGEYLMGSPKTENGRYDNESPQHLVKVKPFYISQTPITQEQWRAIAALPKEALKLNPEPSHFKRNELPVEQIRWREALEFCARLSRYTQRNYRLPSEAEWEYACRAIEPRENETDKVVYPPFHFGETLTRELANYNANVTYQEEKKGEYRNKTTSVGIFPPNRYGLYDMHGNVWEWCLDPWHGDYKGAPKDGRVWDEKNNDNRYQNILSSIKILTSDKRTHVLRGGSWILYPRPCRSAYRYDYDADLFDNVVGFRVVCAPQDF